MIKVLLIKFGVSNKKYEKNDKKSLKYVKKNQFDLPCLQITARAKGGQHFKTDLKISRWP
jgi:hypothetical protein